MLELRSFVLIVLHRYERAIVDAQRAIDLYPAQAFGYQRLGLALIEKGMYKEAVTTLENAVKKFHAPFHKAMLARACALAGRTNEALTILRELKALYKHSYFSPHSIALVYSGFGDKEQTLHWLEEGYRVHDINEAGLKVFPAWDFLHSDPRYQDLVKWMNYPNG